MKIEYVPFDRIRPHSKNPRLHPPRSIDAIKTSLKRYGFRKPIVLRKDGMVIEAGHGLFAAAKAIKAEYDALLAKKQPSQDDLEVLAAIRERLPEITRGEVPCFIADDDEVSANGYLIADNATAELSSWDYEALDEMFIELEEAGFDLRNTGFEPFEIENIRASLVYEEQESIEGETPHRAKFWMLNLAFPNKEMLDEVRSVLKRFPGADESFKLLSLIRAYQAKAATTVTEAPASASPSKSQPIQTAREDTLGREVDRATEDTGDTEDDYGSDGDDLDDGDFAKVY